MRMGFKYANIPTSLAKSEGVVSQRVQLFEDSIAGSQANCVDGSVMFASVFEAIGLQSLLVIIPGHCMVGVFLDADRKHPVFIETTLMGKTDLRAITATQKFDASLKDYRLKNGKRLNAVGLQSYKSFMAAVVTGANTMEQHQADFKDYPDKHTVIDLEKCRKLNLGQLYSRE